MLCNRLGFDAGTANKQADPILRFISARTGLLDERMPSVFAFTHRTMQEFFAAIGLIEDSISDPIDAGLTHLVRPYFFHPECIEVIRLVAAHVSPKPAEELLKAILDDPDPTGRFLRRGPLMAIRCLADGATVSDRGFVQGILDSLPEQGQNRWLGITMECLAALRSLHGTRYEQAGLGVKNQILLTAKASLDSEEYRAIAFAADEPKPVPVESIENQENDPVLKLRFSSGEFEIEHYIPNVVLFSKDQTEWQNAAGNWLQKDEISDDAKQAIIWFMQYAFDGDPKFQKRIRIRLKRTLNSVQSASVRSAAAQALGMIPKGGVDVSSTLSKRLMDPTEADTVRVACAMALEQTGANDLVTRRVLLGVLNDSNEKDNVRKAAAYGLEESAKFEDVASALFSEAGSNPTSPLSIACIASLGPVIDRFKDSFLRWTDEDSVRAVPAARVLAEAYIAGRLTWSDRFVRQIEDRLQNAGTGESAKNPPCSPILTIVKGLCDARERRGGLRRETVISDALRTLAARIQFAFVYGSVARDDQEQESDVDLMLIGSISQKEITQAIRKMKSVLGREVNPTVYSIQTFSRKYHDDDPFFVGVVDNPKMFVLTDNLAKTEKEFLDELGRLETQSLA